MRKLVLLLVMMIIGLFSIKVHAVEISNDSLKIEINDYSGNFIALTSDGKTLMFKRASPTSYTTINVGGKYYIFEGKPTIENNICTTNYYINEENVNVKQIISLVYNTYTKKNDTMEVKYITTNNGSSSKDIGTRIMLDTMIYGNDNAPFRVPGIGDVEKQLELTGDDVPSYWQVFNDLNDPRLFAQGILTSSTNGGKPDKIQFVNWSQASGNRWNCNVMPNEYIGDSAVNVYWNPKALAPGESREYTTYYGLGDFKTDIKEPIALSITGQNEVVAGQSFTVTSYYQNVTDNEVENVVATLNLPDGFKATTPTTVNLGNVPEPTAVPQIISHSWEVKVDPGVNANRYNYSITVSSNSDPGGVPKTLGKEIDVTSNVENIEAIWFKSINDVSNEKIDETKLDIKRDTEPNYWDKWTTDFTRNRTDGNDEYLFRTSIGVPENVNGLVISSEKSGNIVVDDVLGVFVNGVKVDNLDINAPKQTITVNKKYLMPGATNDILLILKDLHAVEMKVSKLKIQATIDQNNEGRILEFNGFKIRCDENDPKNCKILKYPENLILESYEFEECIIDLNEADGEVEYAKLTAKLTGNVNKYDGWHRIEKLFTPNPDSKICFETSYDGSTVEFEGVKFEQIDMNMFNIQDQAKNINAEVNSDGSILLMPKAEFDIFGEKKECCLYVLLKDNSMHITADGRMDLGQFIEISTSNSSYNQYSELDLSGGMTIDIFTKEVSDYDLRLSTYDDSKIRINIPEFGELTFKSIKIDDKTIKAEGLDFTFDEDCVFDGLRPGADGAVVDKELKELGLNRKAEGLWDLISSCDLLLTLNTDVEVFKGTGIKLKQGSTFRGTVKDNAFGIDYKGKFIIPNQSEDESKQDIEVDVNFSVDVKGNFAFGGGSTLPGGLKIGNLDLSPDDSNSKLSFYFINSVYDNGVKLSPRKLKFMFENVGTDIDFKGNNVKFYINEFTIDEDNVFDNVNARLRTELSLFNNNLKITNGETGYIGLEYKSGVWYLDAYNVFVEIPKVPDKGLKVVSSLKMNSSAGLESFEAKDEYEHKIFNEAIILNGMSLKVTKGSDDKYSLSITTDSTLLELNKVLPITGKTSIAINNFKITADDLNNPDIKISCDQVDFMRNMEFTLGLKFEMSGVRIDFDANKISLLGLNTYLPKVGGLKIYNSSGDEVNELKIHIPEFGVSYINGKWELVFDTIELPYKCLYNLAEANICKITLKGLSLAKNSNDKFEFKIDEATATVASGYTTELKNVTINNKNVIIGGGSLTIPDLNLGGIGINDFRVTFGQEVINGESYPYFGGGCGITIPGLGSIDGSLTVQKYDQNFFKVVKEASFELTLGKGIPLGATGLSLKAIRGSLTRGSLPKNFPDEFKFMFETGPQIKFVSMGLGFVDSTTEGKVITAGADVWVEITNWGFALGVNASIFEGLVQAEVGAAYANDIFAAYAHVRVLCVQGKVVMYVYKYDGKTSVSGEGSISVQLAAGKILNKKILRWRIKIPKNDVWFEGFSAKFGRFTNGKTGFQGSVSFPILGKMSAFVGDGTLKFFTNYDIYVPSPTKKTAAFMSAPLLAYDGPMENILAGANDIPDSVKFKKLEVDGIYKGSEVSFTNNANLDRIVLYATTKNGIPDFEITENGQKILLNDPRVEYEVREVNEEDESENDTGNVGIVVLLAIKKPVMNAEYVIKALNDEEVDLTLVTKHKDPELKINSVTENKDSKTLTVSGEITNTNNDKEIVNLILKSVNKNATNDDPSIVPNERIVATSDADSKTPGVVKFSIEGGKFTAIINTSIMRSGSYSLVAEMKRIVTFEAGEDGSGFVERNTDVNEEDAEGVDLSITEAASTEQYEEYQRQEYEVNKNVVIYNFVNDQMQKVSNFSAKVSSYGTDLFKKGDVDISFVEKLSNRGNDIKLNYIWDKIPADIKRPLSYDSEEKFMIVAQAMNSIISDPDFYDSSIFKMTDPQFADAQFKQMVTKLINKRRPDVDSPENRRLNRILLEAYYPGCFASNVEYNLDVGFENISKTADGYLLSAQCFVDGKSIGNRTFNLGPVNETRISNLTQYESVDEDGNVTLKPITMRISVIPYKYKNPEKGFVYDFGKADLWDEFGVDRVENSIILGPESDKIEVVIGKSNDLLIDDCDVLIPISGYKLPVGGSIEPEIDVKLLKDNSGNVTGSIMAEVESVTYRKVTVNNEEVDRYGSKKIVTKEYNLENASAIFEKDLIDVNSENKKLKFKIVPNVNALEAQEAIENGKGEMSMKIRISNADNPADFKVVTIPFTIEIPSITVESVYPETVNSVTGGIIDIYGQNMFTDTRIYRDSIEDRDLNKCVRVFLGTTELEIIEMESGSSRIAAIVPNNFVPGQYDLKVVGVGSGNTVTWKNKITVVAQKYDWVKIRDAGKVQRGTTGKFYFSLDSKTGYFGEAGLNVKNIPTGWNVVLGKNKVNMNEVVEVVVTVPEGESIGDREIIIQGNDKTNSSYVDIGKITVSVTDTPIDPAISSISKNKGYVGDVISIYGEGFNTLSSAQIVSKAGIASDMTIISSDTNLINAKIKEGAVSGNLRINNSGVLSNALPFTLIPAGINTNFDEEIISLMLVPGESRTINIPNDTTNRYPMTTATVDSILTSVDSTTGNIKISVPESTKSGVYDVFVNIQYPNTLKQRKVVVYVIGDGKTSDDLEREVKMEGRNLVLKISDNNIASIETVNVMLNGKPLTVKPQKTTEGFIIDFGMLNDKSLVTYQITYKEKDGDLKTSPLYEYVVQYDNKYNDEDVYKVSLYENNSGIVKLLVTPKGIFNPTKMIVNYKLNNGAQLTANMTKVGDNWELILGKLAEGTYISGSFVYGTESEDVISRKFLLQYLTRNSSDLIVPWTLERDGNGNAIIKVISTTFVINDKQVIPDSLTVRINLGTGEMTEIPMVKTADGYTANIGCISSGTEVSAYFVIMVDGIKYVKNSEIYILYDPGCSDYNKGLKTEYFNNMNLTKLRLKITEPKVDFDWRTSKPASGLLDNSTYSMRLSGKIQPQYSEEYTLYATVPNGTVKVWVDGVKVISGNGSRSSKVTFTAGKMADIVVTYSSQGNGGIKLEWQSTSQKREVIPQDRLFAVDVGIPTEEPPNVSLNVQYTNENNNIITNHLKPVIKLTNTSTESIPFEKIKLKYWFKTENKGIQTSDLYWVTREQENTVLRVVKLDKNTGENYLEVGFKDTTAELMPGESIEIKAGVNLIDWSNYDQSNDYSFSTSYFGYEDCEEITAYVDEKLAWGIEPENTQLYQGKLDVASFNENKVPNTNMISLSLGVVNRQAEAVKPSDIKIRYWFTNETSKAMASSIWYCNLGNIVNVKTVLNGTTQKSYAEFTFTDNAPLLYEGDSIYLKSEVNSSDWTNFSQLNDYSYDPVNTALSENMKMTAYINDSLVWGVEP